MKLAKERTIMTSKLVPGDVVGKVFHGEMYYYLYGYEEGTESHIFTDLYTGRCFVDNTEREYYYFPNASFNPLGE